MIIIFITCKDRKEAEKISKHLIKKRLIACANIFSVRSLYRWKGKLVDDKETMIMAKSRKEKSGSIIKEVKKIHSYKIPSIEIINSKANKEYEQWVKKTVMTR